MVITRTDLDEIKKVISDEVRTAFTDKFKDQLADTIYRKIEAKFNTKFEALKSDLDNVKTELMAVKRENLQLKSTLDNTEQFSRGRNVRIFGMDETENENLSLSVLKLFNNKLKLDSMNKSDIKNCLRVVAKNPVPDKPRAVLVEFVSVNKRSEVLKCRKLLKGAKISIKEDLTQYRLKLLSAAIAKFSSKNAWCLHGNVYVKNSGGVHRVQNDSDIQVLNI